MSDFQPSSGFQPSDHTTFGCFGDAGEPAAPGSNQAAYAAAAYWLGKASSQASSYVEKAKLLAYATKYSVEASALDAVPGGKLLYGSEVAILTEAATRATSVPSVMAKLLALQGGVLQARKTAQGSNPAYQGERAVSYLPWVLGGGLLLGAVAMFAPRGKKNPAEDTWLAIFRDDVAGSLDDTDAQIKELEAASSGRELAHVARRGAARGLRRGLRLDTGRRVLRKVGFLA